MTSLGIVGLGRMGSSLARALLAEGLSVQATDVDEQARAVAGAAGVVVHDSLAGLVGAVDVVLTSLPTPDVVDDVVSGITAHLRPGSLVIEMSTCGPDLAYRAAAAVTQAGGRFVDAPLSRKAPHMTMLVGGEAGVLGEAADPLGRISSDIVYCGSLGDGYRVKLLNQFVKYSRFLVASEALIYAEMSGLDPSAVLAGLMSGTGAAAGLATAEEMFGDDAEAVARHAPVNTITKDVELARVMFAKADFASPSFDALAEFFLAAGASELRHRPYPEAVRLLEEFRTPARQDPAC